MSQSLAVRLASLGLATVLVVLPGFALWGATSTWRTSMVVRHATELSGAFEEARYAVGAEESLERKYRLEPSEEVGRRHHDAGAAMAAALGRAAALAAPADRLLIGDVLVRHLEYLVAIRAMFAAVDAGDTVAATAIDSAQVDPSFDAIETRVDAAADRHRAEAIDHLAALAAIQSRVLVATPIVFALGLALVGFFWMVLRRYQRAVREGLVREAAAVRSSENRFRGLVQNAADMILICRASGTVTYQSPAAESGWGYAAARLLDRSVIALSHRDDEVALRELWEQLEQAPPGLPRRAEVRLCDGTGRWRDAEFIATNLLHDAAIAGIVVTIRDISERKAFEQQLTRQAFHDALTGLPNRVLFRDRLEQALARGRRGRETVGLLFIDLDNFKLVNDGLGHQVGDRLLVEAAARLRASVGPHDTLARLSGDEFVVVLERVSDATGAIPVAEAIALQFSRPFELDGRDLVVTASIGIAMGDACQYDADKLLRGADLAMYQAKSEGRARHVVFEPSMQIDTLGRLELESSLRRALVNHELCLHYQPIVLLASGELTEVEALVRWQHPTHGLVPPGDFIPIAEETGLIVPLGLWVLEEACRQVAAWHEQRPFEPPLILSVNLSPRQFQQPSLIEDVARVLREAGLAAGCLKLEITEGAIMRDVEATITKLWELKKLGVQLAVDDFGTGYSSLSYLKRLPLDVLKIDRSFINGIGHDAEDTAIVRAVIALAKSLELEVTGEGIETAEQAALLESWGCDLGQGYHFSRPLDAQAAGAMLRSAANRRTAPLALAGT